MGLLYSNFCNEEQKNQFNHSLPYLFNKDIKKLDN